MFFFFFLFRRERWKSRLLRTLVEYETLRLQDLLEFVYCDVYLDLFLCSRADEFSAGKEEYDHFRLVHSVDETWELFGLVHGLLLFSSSMTLRTAFRAWRSDFAPVQTILPELKISVAVLGFFRR